MRLTGTKAIEAAKADAEQAKRLAQDTHAVGVHGATGQDYEEGTLAAGTLVRAIAEDVDQDGDVIVRYQASTDRGETWYDQRSYGRLATREVQS